MNIIVSDGKKEVLIRGGERCFELCEQQKQGDSIGWHPVGWFVDLAAVFNELLSRKVRNSDSRTLMELKETIQTARDELMSVWTLNKYNAPA